MWKLVSLQKSSGSLARKPSWAISHQSRAVQAPQKVLLSRHFASEKSDAASGSSAASSIMMDKLKKANQSNTGSKASASEKLKIVDAEPVTESEQQQQAVPQPAVEPEVVKGNMQQMTFQAETRKLLDIVAHSLYTDKEVFVRELVSNASDALEKLRHRMATGQEISDPYLPLEIHIHVDKEKQTLVIQDYGIGMTRDELVQNLGTIAHSGSLKFLKDLEAKNKPQDTASASASSSPALGNIIGQFGVGFYSTFMVGHKVKVYSRSALPHSQGHVWQSDGQGTYEIAAADGVTRGTKVIISLNDKSKEFAEPQVIENIVRKYSNFLQFDIKVNGKKINVVKALWTLSKNQITEQQHKEFYQFIANSFDSPLYTLHYHTDSPINIRALLYVPEQHMEKFGAGRMDPGVSLFSRRVLIQSKSKLLTPDWMRFVKGVVDSEDIPLNLSREHLQDSALIKRVSNVIVKRVLKYLEDELKADRSKYEQFFNEFGGFLKEGILSDVKWKEELGKLLLCESSSSPRGRLTTLDEYIARMPADQTTIYYLVAPTRAAAENSPYFEAFKRKGYEVLFLYTSLDDFVMVNLTTYGGKEIKAVESAKIDLPQSEDISRIGGDDLKSLLKWMKEVLADRVINVKETTRLSNTPAIIVDHESAAMRRMMRMMDAGRAPPLPKQVLEINPSHPLIVGLNHTRNTNAELAKMVTEQLYDNALLAAGLLDEAQNMTMMQRVTAIMESAVGALKAKPEQPAAADTKKTETTTKADSNSAAAAAKPSASGSSSSS